MRVIRHPHLSVQKAFLRAYDLLKVGAVKVSELAAPAPAAALLATPTPAAISEEDLKPATQTE